MSILTLRTQPAPRDALADADAACTRLARRHYENFTVVSALLDRPVRVHLARLYAYCRTTDDLGDERGGDATEALLAWRAQTVAALLDDAAVPHPVLRALRETVRARALPVQPFLDLIEANLRDRVTVAFDDWDALLEYCRFSAAPVGRMVLGVFGIAGADAERWSDDVCVGLQLANFAQDVRRDATRGRCYLPQSALRERGTRGAVAELCDRAGTLLESGRDLERLAHGAIRVQLSLYRLGGTAIVDAVRRSNHRTDERRPTVSTVTKLRLAGGAVPAARARGRPRPGERACAGIARREAANFYWGFVALPPQPRYSVYALYAFARQCDDAVDRAEPRLRAAALHAERERLHAALRGEPADAVMEALAAAVACHAIPTAELDALVDGVERDLTTASYATFDDLREYCGLVASVIGRMCVRIFGFSDRRALTHADELGVALQLTNILRDVREDAGLGRVYLPREDLDRFGVSAEDIVQARHPAGWDALVQFEVARARTWYASGLRVTDHIPRRAAVCVRTMAGIYAALLDEIERNPAAPLQRRLSLSPRRKATVMARAWL